MFRRLRQIQDELIGLRATLDIVVRNAIEARSASKESRDVLNTHFQSKLMEMECEHCKGKGKITKVEEPPLLAAIRKANKK